MNKSVCANILSCRNGIIGFAIGDAMGVPNEFCLREKLMQNPVTEMVGFRSHDVPKGSWSDDTSLTLATMDSIIENKKAVKPKRGIAKKISRIYNDIKRKIRYYYNNIREILAQINDKENREAFVYAVNMIKIPVKYLGLMYVLSAVLGFNLLLEPDFEKEIFELDAGFKGHVSVYKVLVWVLELYSNDKLKIVIDDIL